ncbi:MAG TPA: hypothetical protein VNW97_19485 [Candidatus Saccharimonadales bacterium]|jgi:hypothetical protein|nr:hypothetical protein [Candidatus Saccharimonadales bacterium]
MKTEVYESLSVINRAVEQVSLHIQRLRELSVIGPEFAEIRRLTAEQVRAEVNHKVIMIMAEAETQSASLLGKLKAAEQEKLQAEERS